MKLKKETYMPIRSNARYAVGLLALLAFVLFSYSFMLSLAVVSVLVTDGPIGAIVMSLFTVVLFFRIALFHPGEGSLRSRFVFSKRVE